MAPIGSHHAGTVGFLTRLFVRAVVENALVWVQNPIVLDDYSEPEPDIALLRPRDDFYKSLHPRSSDILLIVEVAESSLDYDRHIKLPLYARNGIPEVWLVDIAHRRLSLYSAPEAGIYRQIISPANLGIIAPRQLSQVSMDVSGLFD